MRIATQSRNLFQTLLLVAVCALPCLASEVAVLKNGFAIKHERRTAFGDVTRLYVSADGPARRRYPDGSD